MRGNGSRLLWSLAIGFVIVCAANYDANFVIKYIVKAVGFVAATIGGYFGYGVGLRLRDRFAPGVIISDSATQAIKSQLLWQYGLQIGGCVIGAVLPVAAVMWVASPFARHQVRDAVPGIRIVGSAADQEFQRKTDRYVAEQMAHNNQPASNSVAAPVEASEAAATRLSDSDHADLDLRSAISDNIGGDTSDDDMNSIMTVEHLRPECSAGSKSACEQMQSITATLRKYRNLCNTPTISEWFHCKNPLPKLNDEVE